MKLFGEYLVEQKLISPEALLACLIKQIQSQQTVVEIIYQNKLISEEKILQALSLQVREGLEFKAAAVKLEFWNADLEKNISLLSQKKRVPLGQILCSEGYLSLQDLTKALDEFVSTYSVKNESASVDLQFNCPDFQSEQVSSYLEIYTQEKNEELLNLIATLNANNISYFKQEIHILKGAARFIGVDISDKIITLIENALLDSSFDLKGAGVNFFSEAFQILWLLRTDLAERHSEKLIWSNPALKDKITKLILGQNVLKVA